MKTILKIGYLLKKPLTKTFITVLQFKNQILNKKMILKSHYND